MKTKHLKIKKAEVNFVYSCIPALNGVNISFKSLFGEYSDSERKEKDIIDYKGFSFAEKENELQEEGIHKVNKQIVENLKKYNAIKFKRYRPHCRKGISHYLSLDLDMGFVMPDLLLKDCKLQYNDRKYTNNEVFEKYKKPRDININGFDPNTTDPNEQFTFDIKPIIRIFPNGVSCTLKIIGTSINNEYFFENEVYKILHLIGLNQNCAPNYFIEFKSDNINYEYDLFDEDKNDQSFFRSDQGVIKITLFNLFKLLIKKLIQDPLSARFPSDNHTVSLLCGKHLIKKSRNSQNSHFEHKETQSPWVVSNLELESSILTDISQRL